MTGRAKRRRRQWPYALALLALVPASLALPLRNGYSDARELMARDRERVVVAPADRAVTWEGATWRFLAINETGTEPGATLPTGSVHVMAALTVTPHDRAAAKRLSRGCDFELRDRAGRIWSTNDQFVSFQLRVQLDVELPGSCEREDGYQSGPMVPGEEYLRYEPFVIPRAALSQVDLRVVLPSASPRRALRFAR